MWQINFVALTDKFGFVRIDNFKTENDVMLAIEQYAKENGFKDVKMIDDGGIQVSGHYTATATTPDGRKRCNIAFVEPLVPASELIRLLVYKIREIRRRLEDMR